MGNFLKLGTGHLSPQQIARSCRQLGWIGFWLQTGLGFVPLLVVVITVFSHAGDWPGGIFSFGLGLAIVCLGILLFSIYWCFRYTRLAARLETPSTRPGKSQVKRDLLLGLVANLSIIAIAVLIAMGRISQLTFRMLSLPQGAGVAPPAQPTAVLIQGAFITPSNMIALQAMVNAIAAGLVGVIIALLLIHQVSRHRPSPDSFS